MSTSHSYLATACAHGLHADCRLFCKWCPDQSSPCLCPCHSAETVPYPGYDAVTEAALRSELREELLRRGIPVGARRVELLADIVTATLARISKERE